MNIGLVTTTWSYANEFDIKKTSLFKSFKKFNPEHHFLHFHFNRGQYRDLEFEFTKKFGNESEFILYKVHLLKNKLENVDLEYIIFCDANDVVCLGSVDYLTNIFDLKEYIIVGTEKNQWPPPEIKNNWIDFGKYSEFDSRNDYYLNSGTVLSSKSNLINLLSSIEQINIEKIKESRTCGGDQTFYTWHYTLEKKPTIKLDYSSVFSLNTFKRSTNDFYLNTENRIVCKKNGTKPCFIHDNGWNHGSPKFLNHFELRRIYSETYAHLKNISKDKPIPISHKDYLIKLKNEYSFYPKTIWDIGACVLCWTTLAREVWPDADYCLFDAMEESEELFLETNHRYFIGVLSDADNKEVKFFKNVSFPGGNSYYMENPQHSSMAKFLFENPENQFIRKTITLDTVQKQNNFPMPDLLKIDVQGCEVDILKGATNVLKNVKHLIVELQHVEYNIGAQLSDFSIPFIENLGFKLVTPKFSENSHIDADYHFVKL